MNFRLTTSIHFYCWRSMRKIDNPVQLESISDFLTIYEAYPKPMLYWDTCGVLDIIRFIYRQDAPNTWECIKHLIQKVRNNEIYVVASELSVKEWNDNVVTVFPDFSKNLKLTTHYHGYAVNIINDLTNSEISTSDLTCHNLEQHLEDLAFEILNNTHFLNAQEASYGAILRVAEERAPAKKKAKQEVKDCAIWETMCMLSEGIQRLENEEKVQRFKRVFYTVNTDDFVDKGKEPRQFFNTLITEAVSKGFGCALSFVEVYNKL